MKKIPILCGLLLTSFLYSTASANGSDKVTPPPVLPVEAAAAATEGGGASTPAVAAAAVPNLQVKAVVPEGFDKTILINFTSDGGGNAMSRLDRINEYVTTLAVNVGTYKVDFVNIVGENASNYNIAAPKDIVVSESGVANVALEISLKETVQKAAAVISRDTQPERKLESPPKEEIKNEVLKPDVGSSIKEIRTTKEKNHDKSTAVETKDKEATTGIPAGEQLNQTANFKGSTVWSIIVGGCALLLVLLFFLYKQVRYKHNYYDC